jgi:hypothetical protein
MLWRGERTTSSIPACLTASGVTTDDASGSTYRSFRRQDIRSPSNGRCVPRPDDLRILLVNRIDSSVRSVHHGSSITENENAVGFDRVPARRHWGGRDCRGCQRPEDECPPRGCQFPGIQWEWACTPPFRSDEYIRYQYTGTGFNCRGSKSTEAVIAVGGRPLWRGEQ